MKSRFGRRWIPWLTLAAVAACAGPQAVEDVDPVVHVERLDEATSETGLIWFHFVGGYDYGLPTAKLQEESRLLFKTAEAFTAHFGTAPPSGIDWATEWVVFYTPGEANLVRGSWATFKSVRVSSTGLTLSITTRHILPGDCEPGSTRPYAIAAFTKPAPAPTYTRFYRSDYTKSCGEGTTEYDGIAFTTTQEAAALTAANYATEEELGAVGISGAQKNIIIGGRTWGSLGLLAGTTGIGSATMEKLRTLSAQFTGSEPPPDPTTTPAAGTYDGVSFTLDEATGALTAANQATETELGSVGISGTQKNIIIGGRTWVSLAALADTSGIGTTTMERLRTLSARFLSTQEEGGTYDGVTFTAAEARDALGAANQATEDQLGAAGITGSPRSILLAGRPWANLSAVAETSGIGPATMEKLRTLGAQLAGGQTDPTPEPEPTGPAAGTYDGVAFTLEQATVALRLVNEESDGVLRVEIGFDSRAVTSIINARPIVSMDHLAGLYYVGTAGLERLRDYVTRQAIEPKRCRITAECPADQRCVGVPTDGSSEYGLCRDLTPLSGEGASCASESDCGSGLFCAGLTLWSEGTCNPDWMKGRFENITQRYIPEVTDQPVATGVVVTGLASVPVDVVLELNIGHSNPSSLRITLTDPNGQEVVAWDGPTQGGSIPTRLVVRGISGDDQVNGRWLLRIWNAKSRGSGNIYNWTLELTSRWD